MQLDERKVWEELRKWEVESLVYWLNQAQCLPPHRKSWALAKVRGIREHLKEINQVIGELNGS